ncbi:MAG TPA: ankyrin repeat domain-containing protein [Planctomycetota bacterium]|nr:ankyrin repeat domain-containing protein [Planctomycetota bacterium]
MSFDFDFKWSDAWLLQAVWSASASGRESASLKGIVGMGDAFNHAIFTIGELRNGFSKLVRAGYLSEEEGAFKVDGAALRFLEELDKKPVGGPIALIDRTASFLCASPYDGDDLYDPAWPYPSVTDGMIAKAYKDYSREFGKKSKELDEASRSLLANAYLRKDVAKLKELIEEGADVNVRDKDGKTVLMHAAGKANLGIVQYLVEKGASLGLTDQQGDTALHHAARRDSEDLVRYLIDRGSVVDARDRWGGTPLWVAVKCSKGKGEVIRLLLSKGADPHLKGARGKTPLELAREREDFDLLRYFEGS